MRASFVSACIGIALHAPAGAVELAQQMGPTVRAPDPAAIVKRMDKNGDGKLSREEFPGPPQRFQMLDGNGDGFVSADEFATMMKKGPPDTGSGGPASQHPLAEWYRNLPVILTHTHFNTRTGSGREQFDDWRGTVANANEVMAKYGIRAAVIMSTPRSARMRDDSYFDNLLRIARDHPKTFFPSGGGESLNGMINSIRPDRVDESVRRDFAARATYIARAGAVGFGETTALHLSLWRGHPFEETPPDHPLFLLLADIAAKYDIPIDLHVEAVRQTWTVSQNIRDRGGDNPRQVSENLAALERLFAHNPKARFIWVHVGWDATGYRTVELTRRFLRKFPNLYMSITNATYPEGSDPLFVPGAGLNPKWRALILEFPDRFMIGSDTFFQPANSILHVPQSLQNGTRIVRFPMLPPDVARKVAFENAERLFKLDVIKPDDYPLPAGQRTARPPAAASPAQAATSPAQGEEMRGPRGLTANQVIANLDADGDKKIGPKEFPGAPQMFGMIDANGDGFVTKDELEARWRQIMPH